MCGTTIFTVFIFQTNIALIFFVAQLQYEISVVSEYLPAEADIATITKVVEAAIAKVNPQSPADFGKIMKEVMSANLNADGNVIKQIVNEKLKK